MEVVLDTNIYIAAYLAKGLASDILKKGTEGKIKIYTSPDILKELDTRLVDKLKIGKTDVRAYLKHVNKSVNIVIPQTRVKHIKADPDDNKILECAVEVGADLIVTMDKHLLKFKSYEGIGVVHPKTLTWIIPKFFGGK